MTYRALAPAKINLGLRLGPMRADGRHELVTVMQSISLADELTLELAPDGLAEDEVRCPGVAAPNLAGAAVRAFRDATGWDAPPLLLSIAKRVPVAAGLGGGSADAAAALRLCAHASGLGDQALLLELAARLGADVPAQVSPGRWLAGGTGERLQALPDPARPFGVLVLGLRAELSTADVYAEADHLGVARDAAELEQARRALRIALELGAPAPAPALLANDLQDAARVLCPESDDALREAREAGADVALVSGSGPTVVGLFLRSNGAGRAARAVAALADRTPAPIAATPVGADFGAPAVASVRHNQSL